MSNSVVQKRNIRTLSPIYSPISVTLGSDQSSVNYSEMLMRLPELNAQCEYIHKDLLKERHDYTNIDNDSRDNRLLLWVSSTTPALKIHVFPNNIAVVELDLMIENDLSAIESEKLSQHLTLTHLKTVYPEFLAEMAQLAQQEKHALLQFDQEDAELHVYWISRALLVNQSMLENESTQLFLKAWLKSTQRPEDAQDIINRKINFSMTWLNYVIVESELAEMQIDTMILAQYFYTAQERCNKLLKQAIDSAYSSTNLLVAEKKLSTSRVLSRLHQIDFHEHQKYLKRIKRQMLNDILACWDFAQLTENGLRMVEVCTSRLQEADNKKRERSTVMTDLLLVTLSFFAVFELSLYLTELSREMMSRPALAFNDENSSFFLELIADIDVDVMFGFGFGLTFALIIIYKKIKSK